MSEQPKPRGRGQAVFPRLHKSIPADLKAREAKGIATYGEGLRAWNGRNPFQDAKEELLDGLAYVEQAAIEQEGLRARVRRLGALLIATAALVPVAFFVGRKSK